MVGLFLRRLVQSIFVVLVVAIIAFCLFQFVGDPIHNMLGQDATPEQQSALRERLGLDKPKLVQFSRFIVNFAHGDLGLSYRMGRPVSELIAERLPATIELSLVSGLFAVVVGIWMGVAAAVSPGSVMSRVLMTLSLVGTSLPPFFVGILLIVVFSVQLGWLPSFGRGEVVRLGFWTTGLLTPSGLKALILPGITLGLFQLTLIMRLVRSQMLEVLRSDFIKFARARGLPEPIVTYRHALKNTLVPIITITGLQIGSIIAFSIITETVFQWPGMGLLFIQAVGFADIPIIASYLLLVSMMFVAINLTCDLLYHFVDPRLLDRTLAAATR
jgi:peptide/nickel transport system permease protein